MSRFFIDRPVFAWVLALTIMLIGALSVLRLPVEQYPRIAPPSVAITTSYPGASAQTLENTVTQVIEQKMNGLDHLRYMGSTSDSTGSLTITLTFDPEANPDIAQVQVQNKLQLALPLLPQEVQQQGVKVAKAAKSFLMVIGLVSTDGRTNANDLTDYLSSRLQDDISRVPGVGEVMVFGAPHAMRVWLDTDKLVSFKLSVADVVAAVKAENAEVSAGQIGGAPALPGQRVNATIVAQNRMETPEQFGEILIRVTPEGSRVRLKDVARLEIGAENYETVVRYNGRPAAGMAIKLGAGANALDTAEAVRHRMGELSGFFPPGVEAVFPFDTTPFVRVSIEEVVKTLAEAIGLVFLVMYLFLQNFRATLIPTIAVPVVLLGTFGVLGLFGFSINTLTMFGMVLAIGLLVDDAIVVVENVERLMTDDGLSPREATRKSMDQITGALVGIALVLSAVFVPMAFFGGSTGVIYRQFSLTLVTAMALSVLVALILTPALCASILKPVPHGMATTGFFGWFNRNFERSRRRYDGSVAHVLGRTGRYLLLYGGIMLALVLLMRAVPGSFLPEEDQGVMFVLAQAPAGASQERMRETLKTVEEHFLNAEKESVAGIFTVAGFSFAGRGQSGGLAFVNLKDWSQRQRPDQQVLAIAGKAMGAFSRIKDALVFAFPPPAVMELGNASGFDFQLQDQGGLGHEALMQARNQLLGQAARNPALAMVRPNGMEDTPQLRVTVDREKAGALGLSLADINTTLSATWGSVYVNDFIESGRVKKVILQADAPFRMQPGNLERLQVRNNTGEMVPFSTFSSTAWSYGSPQLERYNGIPSRDIMGSPAPGHSSGQAMAAMEEIARTLPPGIGFSWAGLSYEERLAGSQAPALYAISILVVFLCLAALYESWSIPMAVLMVVPLGVVGAVAAVYLRGLPNDVYLQVGLLTTIGLAAKNAILIVEFAKDLHEQGHSLAEAAALAARQRLRPILMTSLAFMLGVLPLAIAHGAGSGAQNAIGTSVLGGMVSATVLAIFLVPLFFVVVLKRLRRAIDPALQEA
ncbi:MAG: efflux RND transporter permease subunit [Rhodospirillaceae bacterium]